jgi:glycosyltransferase involved in cell wall biosynthesis
MAAGTPVIGSDVGGIREIVEDGATGFRVSPGDEIGLVDRLRWILEHPEEALDMGHRAQDLAKKLFSAEGYIQGYQRIFEAAQVLRARNAYHAPSTL